ncbi:hypothetical protein HG537_0F04680 [Torulaspora globosa]|uniref:BHLH domain-containing protein n=1 Tax=Torulaspora globosa TaxID=48254 RepID=A0A7H9HY01_9SACH|nr:hypothetical protein HG537_0F04680 [Torulaspora sp. CBS 2947]
MNSTMLATVAPQTWVNGNEVTDEWIFNKQGGDCSDSSSWSWFEPLENIISSTATSSVGSPINGTCGVFTESEQLFTDPSSYENSPVLLPVVKREEPDELRVEPQVENGKKKRAPRKRLTSHQKQAHNKIEKRYRININTKIAKLQQIIPWVASEQTAFEVGDSLKAEDGAGKEVAKQLSAASATKLNKSMILEKAVDYILYLQNSERLYEMEVQRLKDEVDALKKGFRAE